MVLQRFTSFVMHIVLLVVFLGLIRLIFDLHRFAFFGEFLIMLVLLLVALISLIGINNNFRWAWILLAVFFAFVFIDIIFVYAISTQKPDSILTLLIITIAGFFISLFSVESQKSEESNEESPKVEAKKEVKKTFKPGKFIASKTGTKYHAPKCDWAKRIKNSNAVWFDSKEAAKKADFKADSCVKR